MVALLVRRGADIDRQSDVCGLFMQIKNHTYLYTVSLTILPPCRMAVLLCMWQVLEVMKKLLNFCCTARPRHLYVPPRCVIMLLYIYTFLCNCITVYFFPILQWGRTPLHYASSRGHTKVVEMLLQAKIDINDGDKVCLPHSLCRHNNYCYVAPDIFFYYRMG